MPRNLVEAKKLEIDPEDFLIEKAKQAKKLCALGATDKDLADFFEVNISTIHRWRAQYPVFNKAMVTGKELADERVERALYSRAVGYDYETEKVVRGENPTVIRVQEHIPPDIQAGIFWLKNRRKGTWRDKVETQVDGKLEVEWLK